MVGEEGGGVVLLVWVEIWEMVAVGGEGGDSLEAWEEMVFFLEGLGEGHGEDEGGASRGPGRRTYRPRRGHLDSVGSRQHVTPMTRVA